VGVIFNIDGGYLEFLTRDFK
nr:40 kda gap junction protein {N-terminal} [Heliothis virescens=tobacco budworm TBW, larvae, Peptide Partial, 20 aa] [Heliothis virescens]